MMKLCRSYVAGISLLLLALGGVFRQLVIKVIISVQALASLPPTAFPISPIAAPMPFMSPVSIPSVPLPLIFSASRPTLHQHKVRDHNQVTGPVNQGPVTIC